MDNIHSVLDQYAKKQLSFRGKRLLQVFWFVEIALAGIFVNHISSEIIWLPLSLLGVMVLLSSVYFLIKNNQIERAAVILVSTIALFLTLLMWVFGGLHDEVMLAFPGLLIICGLLGNRKLFLVLVIFIMLNVFLNGYVNSKGWYINQATPSTMPAAVVVSIVMLVTAAIIWLLSADLGNVLQKLSTENVRVKESEKKIQRLVQHDSLTDLPNRLLAHDRFEHALLASRREAAMVCLMFLDLDDFKAINDSFGHNSGDLFLREVARRLQQAVRNTDTICRQGGDEFLVILESITAEEQVSSVAIKILDEVKKPFDIAGSSVTCTVSIGIAVAPEDGVDFDTLCKNADIAMYHAKDLGRNSFHFYNEAMADNAEKNIRLVSDLRQAIDKEQFELHYQPKINLADGSIIGAEALIRWRHPENGMIYPLDFISLAESSGIIFDMGEWVIQQACKDCQSWIDMGLGDLTVAVNVSAIQFKRGNISSVIHNALSSSHMAASRLELELTESTLIDDSEKFRAVLSNLRSYGVEFSIDDFGTGYSNLGYLKKMEVGILKIDQSFVRRMLSDSQDKAIVQAVIQIAKSLKLKTTAEGVEKEEAIAVLRDLGCDYGQGYFWSMPLPNDEFVRYVQSLVTGVG